MIMLYDALLVIAIMIIAGAVALPFTGNSVQAGRDIFFTIYLLAAWFSYLGLCWVMAGQTMGMRAWKVHLIRVDGSDMDWRNALIRFSMSLVSAAGLGLGFWLSLLRPDRACWHDRISKTRLIRQE